MKCRICNFKNPPGFKFCGNCGDSLSRLCSNCNHENIQQAKFCNRCGAILANLCPNCRTDNPKSATFCSECGMPLGKVCSECRTINPLHANYCNSCGTSLPEIVIAAAPSVQRESAQFIRPIIQPPKAPEVFVPQQTITKALEPEVAEQGPEAEVPGKTQVEQPVLETPTQKAQVEISPTAEVTALPEDKPPEEEEPEGDYDRLKMLEAYIPPALREELYTYRGKIEGERKLVTIVFSDVSGFTTISERYADEPEEMQRIINECLKREIDEVYKLQGIPDKVVADEVMALFGAPITHENDAERAIQAAMAMRKAAINYGNEIGIPLDVHIGINTGNVSIGSIGGSKLLNYTAIGPTVNLASRLEHEAKLGEIVVGELTYKLTKAKFDFEPPSYAELKNITGEQPIYKLIGPKEHPESVRGIAGLISPMVGREIEFETLMACARKAMAGDFQLVSITGEAGLGKSRLKRELENELSDEVIWIEGQCQSHTEHVAYSIFLSAMKSHFGVTGLNTEEEIKNKITNGITELFSEDSEISPEEEILPYIFNLMPVKLSDKQSEKIKYLQENPEELQKQTFAAIKHILMQAVKQSPIVLALEDLHWLDEVSYELILFLMDNLAGTPTLLLNIYRPEVYGAPGTGDRLCWKLGTTTKEKFGVDKYTEVRLGRMPEENMELILDSMLNLEDTQDSRDLKEMILHKAEGNPFYLEEVIRTLIEDVVIQPEEGGNGYVIVDGIENIDVPVGVQSVVRARIDRVRGTPKQTLQHASVIGRNFPFRILEYISPQDNNLNEDLDRLINLELIDKLQNSSELEYNFQHILTYETAYDSIIVSKKKELHGLVGNYLSEHHPEEVYLDQIAYHYKLSNQTDKAVNYLIKAGKKAQDLYSKSDAIDYYSDALQRMQDMSEDTSQMQMIAHEGLGDIYGLDGQFDVALDNYTRVLEHPQPPESIAVVFRKAGEIYQKKGDNATALEQYQAGLAELDGEARSPEVARILTDIGYIYYLDGKYPEAIQMNTQALEVVEGTEHYYIQALVYKNLGNVYALNDFDRTIEYWEKSREILEKINAGIDLAKLYNNFGDLYLKRADKDKAQFYFQKSLEQKEKLGDVNGLIVSYDNYGQLYRRMGEFDKSLRSYEKGLEIAERIGNVRRTGLIKLNLATLYSYWGKYEKAIELFEECLTIFEKINHTQGLAYSFLNIGDAHCKLGNLDEAVEYQNKALEVGKQLNDPYLVSGIYNAIGKVYLKKQDYDTAIDYFCKALEISAEKEFWEMAGNSQCDLGKAYIGKESVDEARTHLNEAIEIFKKLGDDAEVEKIKEIKDVML